MVKILMENLAKFLVRILALKLLGKSRKIWLKFLIKFLVKFLVKLPVRFLVRNLEKFHKILVNSSKF